MYHHHVVVTSTTLVVVALCFLCISWVAQGGESFVIEQKQWDFLQKHDVGYEVAKAAVAPSIATTSSSASSIATAESSITRMMSNDNGTATEKTTKIETISTVTAASWTSSQSTPILLLNGFGVGSFHQHRLIERFFAPSLLSSSSRLSSTSSTSTSTVYCMDYLGQGRSWPKDCQDGRSPNEDGLQYSAEMWVQQIIQFIEDIIRPSELKETACASSSSASISGTGRLCKVHVVGNSVGGHLAAHIAARRPDLVESIVLLNPTPVWGLNLPGWSGHLPPPPIPRLVGRFLFDRIRDLRTIESFLRETYSRRSAFSDELVSIFQIQQQATAV
jgi:pimeloyl-ACP methyl ester carboxylesterase